MTNAVERALELVAFILLVAAAVAFWFVTPANADTTTVRGPSGALVYTTKCSGSQDGCYQEASTQCRGGPYQILSSESHGGGIFGDVLNGPINYYSVSYQCGRSDGRLADFPRTSPYYQPPRPFIAECGGNNWGVGCIGWR